MAYVDVSGSNFEVLLNFRDKDSTSGPGDHPLSPIILAVLGVSSPDINNLLSTPLSDVFNGLWTGLPSTAIAQIQAAVTSNKPNAYGIQVAAEKVTPTYETRPAAEASSVATKAMASDTAGALPPSVPLTEAVPGPAVGEPHVAEPESGLPAGLLLLHPTAKSAVPMPIAIRFKLPFSKESARR